MEKLNKQLAIIKASNKPGFMMHTVAGYPDMKSSAEIASTILDAGADILEIQIPFSDPVADGPVIAAANEIALRGGATVEDCLDLIKDVTDSTDKPILIMTYFNIVHHYGVEKFTQKAREIDVQGLIVPDYPFDEDGGNGLIEHCHKNDLALIQVMASTTRPERRADIIEHASGLVYCMARTGTTGEKTVISSETKTYLESVKRVCPLPLAVGFGLSDREQVQALKPHADIMVVGSALIKEYADKPLDEGLQAVRNFMRNLTSKP